VSEGKNDRLYCCSPANVKITLPQKFDSYVEISEFRQNICPCDELIVVTVFSLVTEEFKFLFLRIHKHTQTHTCMYVCVCVCLCVFT